MGKYKYSYSAGVMLLERGDLKTLEKYARKGYQPIELNSFGCYKLEEREPQNLMYELDYTSRKLTGQDLTNYITSKGTSEWKHVFTFGDRIHYFAAPEGSKPFFLTKEEQIGKYERYTTMYSATTIVFLLTAIMVFIASTFLERGIPKVVIVILSVLSFALGLLFSIGLLFNHFKNRNILK